MKTYKIELTFGEACKIESAILHKIEIYKDFLSTAIKRNDEQSADTWQNTLDEYNNIVSKIQTETNLS